MGFSDIARATATTAADKADKAAARANAIEYLKQYITRDTTIYIILRIVHHRRSELDTYVIHDNRPLFITPLVAEACGLKVNGSGRIEIPEGMGGYRNIVAERLAFNLFGSTLPLNVENL